MALGSSLRAAIGTAWRSVQSGVQRGMSVFGIGERIQSGLEQAGLPPTLIDTSVVDQLAGMAQGIESATQNLGNAPPDALIDSSMVSLAPWSADLNTFNAAPGYRAHIEVQYIDAAGEPQTAWRYVTGIRDVNMTVAEFQAAMRLNAEAMMVGTTPGGGIGGTVTGIGDISITVAPAGP